MLQSLCKNSFAGAFKANLILQKYNKLGFFFFLGGGGGGELA